MKEKKEGNKHSGLGNLGPKGRWSDQDSEDVFFRGGLMGKSMRGQVLVKVGQGKLVLAWDNVFKDEVLDSLEILTEWVASGKRNYYMLRGGTRTGDTVILKSLRPLPEAIWEKGLDSRSSQD
jgi:hypothetical protein